MSAYSVFHDPCGSLNIWEISNLSKINITIALQQIKEKCVHLEQNYSQDEDRISFVLPFLHEKVNFIVTELFIISKFYLHYPFRHNLFILFIYTIYNTFYIIH